MRLGDSGQGDDEVSRERERDATGIVGYGLRDGIVEYFIYRTRSRGWELGSLDHVLNYTSCDFLR